MGKSASTGRCSLTQAGQWGTPCTRRTSTGRSRFWMCHPPHLGGPRAAAGEALRHLGAVRTSAHGQTHRSSTRRWRPTAATTGNSSVRAPPPIVFTTTIAPLGLKSSLSAAMVQGLKTENPLGTAAALRQRMRVGDCLGRETVSPTRRVSVGTLQSLTRG